MPKYTADPENVTSEAPDISMITSDQVQPSTTSAATVTKELSKKELGRMKSKQAVLAAKAKERQRPEVSEDRVRTGDDDVDFEEPETKRARSAVDSGHGERKEEMEEDVLTSEV